MELFRREAIESFSSSAKLNSGVQAIRIRTVVFLLLLLLCAMAFAYWLVCGTIYETVTVSGAVWPIRNAGTVYATYGGTVSKTVVSEGDVVKAGDILLVIPQADVLAEIEAAKQAGASDDELNSLYDKYDSRSIVRASIDGAVTYITEENRYISEGDVVAAVVPYDKDGNNRTLTAFIPSRSSGFITLGMEVQIMPDFAPRDEYGYIEGYISGISTYPLTGQSVEETGGTLLAGLVEDTESYLPVEITMIPDMTAQSGLKWSNPSSGNINIAMGTICTADIVVEKCRPYEWLF